jgi:hypothetical protein
MSTFYTLDSGVDRNREAPDTFQIPPAAERENLQPGQIAKLMFRIDDGAEISVERMWVRVHARDGDEYVGVLDNDAYGADLRHGLEVRFRPEHVIQIWRDRR